MSLADLLICVSTLAPHLPTSDAPNTDILTTITATYNLPDNTAWHNRHQPIHWTSEFSSRKGIP